MPRRPEPRFVAAPTGEASVIAIVFRCPTTGWMQRIVPADLAWIGTAPDPPTATVYCPHCERRHALRFPQALDGEEG